MNEDLEKLMFDDFFQVEGLFYVNEHLEKLMFDELKKSCGSGGFGGFLPGMKQIANVAALPGIVHVRKNKLFNGIV